MNEIEHNVIGSDLLRSFLIIAETGKLTQAAHRLGRTQSAISVQLRNLEDHLGTTLFERSTQGMTLTNAGERFLPRAQATLSQLQDLGRMFDAPLQGRLRIGIPDDYEGRILTQALARFIRLHPDVDVTALSGCTTSYPEALRNGHLDMAVCSGPEPLGNMHISTEQAVWATAKDARIDTMTPLPLAVLDRACWWKSIPTNALREADRDFRIAFRTESFGSLVSALKAGFAVGVLPASCLTKDLRILGAPQKLPKLPRFRRSILFSQSEPDRIARSMAQIIAETMAV